MDNSEDKMPGGVAKKIDVSFNEAKKEFNEPERTLEDIVDEELANEPKDDFMDNRSSVERLSESEPVEIPRASEDISAPKPIVDEPERESVEEIREPVVEERPVKVHGGRRSGKGLIVFLIILIILISLGFLAYYLLSTQTIKNDFFAGNDAKCETPAKSVDKKDVSIVEGDEEVKVVIDGLKDSIAIMQIGKIRTTYDSDFPMHKINEDGTLVSLNRSYGLHISNYGEDWLTTTRQFNAKAVEYLTSVGFEKYADGLFGAEYYKNNGSNIICGGITNLKGGEDWAISCAKEEWVLEEDEQLEKELAEAYKVKTGNSIGFIMASVDDIKGDGSKDGFLTVSVRMGGARGLFYRQIDVKGGKHPWVFVLGAQEIPDCSGFNDEAKEAFKGSGEPCVNPNPDGTYTDEMIVTL